MLKKTLLALALLSALPGCTSLMATASGPGPVGAKPGERTMSMRVDDISIENTANINIYKADPALHDANITVVSFYGSVLLAGQVQTEALKQKAEQVVNDIAEVKKVHNALVVGNPTYYLARANDGVISTRVSTALTFEPGFPSSQSKVTTVNGVVYLMGKLTHADADKAVKIISGISGVQKIVMIVDYLDTATATTATAAPASTATPAPAPADSSAPAQ